MLTYAGVSKDAAMAVGGTRAPQRRHGGRAAPALHLCGTPFTCITSTKLLVQKRRGMEDAPLPPFMFAAVLTLLALLVQNHCTY